LPFVLQFTQAESHPASDLTLPLGRIHFNVHYPELDEARRKAVWTNFLTTIAKSTEVAEFDEGDVAKLAQHTLNGRQIKNIVACAVSLAREKKTTITVTQIETLVKILME
jgi:hypothetical protein